MASLYTLTCVYNVTPCSSHNQRKSIPNELLALALYGLSYHLWLSIVTGITKIEHANQGMISISIGLIHVYIRIPSKDPKPHFQVAG